MLLLPARFDWTSSEVSELHGVYQASPTHVKHAVEIVEIAMLPAAVVNIVTRHADLRTVEYRRLVRSISISFTIPPTIVRTSFMSFQMCMSVVLSVQANCSSDV